MKARSPLRLGRVLVLPPDDDTPPQIARHFRRNFIANTGNLAGWNFSNSFMASNTILPVFASHLTSSPLIIGLVPAITDALWFLPQLFFAPLVERLPRKLPLIAWLGLLERVPSILLPLLAFWLGGAHVSPALPIVLFLLLITWKSTASGMSAVPWQELTAKLIPSRYRGRFFSLANVLGQLLGIGGALIAARFLEEIPYPLNFSLCFLAGCIVTWVGYASLMCTKEPALPSPASGQSFGPGYLRRLGNILKNDRNYSAYLTSRWLTYLGGMANGFLAVYAVEHFHAPDATAAILGGVQTAAAVGGNLVWGPLCDRIGYKPVLVASCGLWVAGLGIAWASTSLAGFYLVFILLGVSMAGSMVADFGMVMILGPENERPTYMGLARSVTGPALLAAPIIGGWVASTWSYAVLFIAALVISVLGMLVMGFWVHNPRRRTGIQLDRSNAETG